MTLRCRQKGPRIIDYVMKVTTYAGKMSTRITLCLLCKHQYLMTKCHYIGSQTSSLWWPRVSNCYYSRMCPHHNTLLVAKLIAPIKTIHLTLVCGRGHNRGWVFWGDLPIHGKGDNLNPLPTSHEPELAWLADHRIFATEHGQAHPLNSFAAGHPERTASLTKGKA